PGPESAPGSVPATAPGPESAPGSVPATAPGPESGRLLGGRYRLVARLGHGGMGTVWRAHDEVVDRRVAVKEPRVPGNLGAAERETLALRMRREARAAARIGHPAVVTVHDVVVEDGKPWLVMELVPGRSLGARLAEGTLDVREAARIGLAVLGALDAAHEAGVLHRDVKPDNILLAPRDPGRPGYEGEPQGYDGEPDHGPAERVVLTDFGIARVEGEQGLTETGAFVGSPEYIAPERVRGERPGPASDLWSLGVVLYTAVEGVSPFRRSNAAATLQAVVSAEPPAPSRGTGPFGPLVLRLLNKDPALRPDRAEVRRTLESLARPPRPVPLPQAPYPGFGAPLAPGAGPAAPGATPPAVPGFGPAGPPAAAAPVTAGSGGPGPGPVPAPRRRRAVWFAAVGGVLALAAAAALVVTDPFGGGDGTGLPGGWEVRNDREVLSASVAVPSDYRRAQHPSDARVTYYDPSGVFEVGLEKVETAEQKGGRTPTPAAWREFYERGGKDGRDFKAQRVTVTEHRHQGAEAFDSTLTYLPYYSAAREEEEVRFRRQERVVVTGGGAGGSGARVYWLLRVSGPAEGWAAKEGDRLFDTITGHLRIEGL
ncbi:serine/threonine-protein kinase, partial [Streptomyces sp. NPDC003691]